MNRVLVIDNEEDIRSIVTASLSVWNIEVVGADSCAAALCLMKTERFGAAIVDLGMPHTDGLTCAAQMKLMNPNIPLFAFTAYEDATKPDRMLHDAGFIAAFRKGRDEQRLFAAVVEAVRRR